MDSLNEKDAPVNNHVLDNAPYHGINRRYNIKAHIEKNGVGRYLMILRKRLLLGMYSLEEYAIVAAQAYLWAKKPYRCLALLNYLSSNIQYPSAAVDQLRNEAFFAASSLPVLCSMNMIAKNEASNIGPALESIDDIADEIVICDTGSTDETAFKASLFGVKIVCMEWQNDFSVARNIAIQNSMGSWIFWLDADDRLDGTSKENFVKLISNTTPHAASFRIVNIQDNMHGADFMQVRLFPRIQGARFSQRIHEQIIPSLKKLGISFGQYPLISVFHTGYNGADANGKKALRNKPLIRAELDENPDSAVLLLSMADCHMILGETGDALALYERIVAHPVARFQNPDVFVQAHFNIGMLYRRLGKNTIAKIWLQKTFQLDSLRTEAIYLLGLIASEENRPDAAFEYFLSCSKKKPPVRQTATDTRKIRIDSIYRVCEYLFEKAQFAQCEDIITSAMEQFPNVVYFHSMLGKVYLQKSDIAGAARQFMKSLVLAPHQNYDACRGMAEIYLLLNDRKKATEFIAMAEDDEHDTNYARMSKSAA